MLLWPGVQRTQAHNRTTTTKIEHIGAKCIALYVDFPMATDVRINIMDEQGTLVFSEIYREITVFARKIDLASLPIGFYRFEVEGPQKIQVYGVRLSDNQLMIDGGKPKVVFKPHFVQRDNFLDVTMFMVGIPKAAVKILASNGDLLMVESVENSMTLEKRFDLSKLRKGNYTAIVSMAGREFSHSFHIR